MRSRFSPAIAPTNKFGFQIVRLPNYIDAVTRVKDPERIVRHARSAGLRQCGHEATLSVLCYRRATCASAECASRAVTTAPSAYARAATTARAPRYGSCHAI